MEAVRAAPPPRSVLRGRPALCPPRAGKAPGTRCAPAPPRPRPPARRYPDPSLAARAVALRARSSRQRESVHVGRPGGRALRRADTDRVDRRVGEKARACSRRSRPSLVALGRRGSPALQRLPTCGSRARASECVRRLGRSRQRLPRVLAAPRSARAPPLAPRRSCARAAPPRSRAAGVQRPAAPIRPRRREHRRSHHARTARSPDRGAAGTDAERDCTGSFAFSSLRIPTARVIELRPRAPSPWPRPRRARPCRRSGTGPVPGYPRAAAASPRRRGRATSVRGATATSPSP